MRFLFLVGLLAVGINGAFAGQLPAPPPLAEEPVEEQKWLQLVFHHHNNLVIVTANPNGNRRGRPGDLIAFNSSGTYKLCLNTSTGPGTGTTWRCSANALTAP